MTITKTIVTGIIVFGVLAGITMLMAAFTGAKAQTCLPKRPLIKQLEQTGEELAGIGLGARNDAFVVYASPTGVFTILRIMPNGMACMIGAGNGWDIREVKAKRYYF